MENERINKNHLLLIFKIFSKRQKKTLIYITILMFIGMLFEMLGLGILLPTMTLMTESKVESNMPMISKVLFSSGISSGPNLLLLMLLILVFFYFIKLIFLLFMTWEQNKFGADVSKSISDQLFYGYLNLPYQFHLNNNSSFLIRNINIEAQKLIVVITTSLNGFTELLVVLGTLIFLIVLEPIGAILVFLIIFLTFLIFNRVTKKYLIKWGLRTQLNSGLMNKHVLQGLAGAKEVAFLNKQSYFLNKFSTHSSLFYQDQVKNNTLAQFPKYLLELVSIVSLAGLIFLLLSINKPLSFILPTMGIFLTAAYRLIPSANRIISAFQQVKFSSSSIQLIYDEFQAFKNHSYLESYNLINHDFLQFKKIKFENVTFCYEKSNQPALENISIEITRGSTIGIIGESGSGKSTLVDLFLGILSPVKGEITVDSFNIKNSLKNWQSLIGYIPQSVYLLDETIVNNVAFGINENEIDYNKTNEAIEKANLTQFISTLPLKLNTFVGERGVRLSGGQKQRIGISRALYNDPLIMVLDEATSALDNQTEFNVMESVRKLKGDKTIIIVAHRLSTIMNCDYLYKIENGKIVSEGTPANLIKN
jgi:ABC-type multidrug transport system fused ATPase/permease subunit